MLAIRQIDRALFGVPRIRDYVLWRQHLPRSGAGRTIETEAIPQLVYDPVDNPSGPAQQCEQRHMSPMGAWRVRNLDEQNARAHETVQDHRATASRADRDLCT